MRKAQPLQSDLVDVDLMRKMGKTEAQIRREIHKAQVDKKRSGR